SAGVDVLQHRLSAALLLPRVAPPDPGGGPESPRRRHGSVVAGPLAPGLVLWTGRPVSPLRSRAARAAPRRLRGGRSARHHRDGMSRGGVFRMKTLGGLA